MWPLTAAYSTSKRRGVPSAMVLRVLSGISFHAFTTAWNSSIKLVDWCAKLLIRRVELRGSLWDSYLKNRQATTDAEHRNFPRSGSLYKLTVLKRYRPGTKSRSGRLLKQMGTWCCPGNRCIGADPDFRLRRRAYVFHRNGMRPTQCSRHQLGVPSTVFNVRGKGPLQHYVLAEDYHDP